MLLTEATLEDIFEELEKRHDSVLLAVVCPKADEEDIMQLQLHLRGNPVDLLRAAKKAEDDVIEGMKKAMLDEAASD